MAVSTIRQDFMHRFVISDATTIVESAMAKGTYADDTKTITKPGYYPLGIVSINVSGTGSAVCVPRCVNIADYAEGSVTIYGGLRNVGTTDATLARLWVRILWVKM